MTIFVHSAKQFSNNSVNIAFNFNIVSCMYMAWAMLQWQFLCNALNNSENIAFNFNVVSCMSMAWAMLQWQFLCNALNNLATIPWILRLILTLSVLHSLGHDTRGTLWRNTTAYDHSASTVTFQCSLQLIMSWEGITNTLIVRLALASVFTPCYWFLC
jgi:hypothetical protein